MEENKILILRKFSDSEFFKYIKDHTIKSYYRINYENFIFKVIRKLNLPLIPILLGNWKKEIKQYNKIILFDNAYNEQVSNFIKSKNKTCKIYFYYWNPINEFNKKYLKDPNIDEIWTFDPIDAKTYNLKYNPQLYTKNIKLLDKEVNNDVIFLGRAKNRTSDILKIKQELEKQNIKTQIYIIENEKQLMEYTDYLKIIDKSKAILDIVNERQNGLTLKCMEAIFFNKKLITNNSLIKEYDFYNKKNIFIIGEDNNEDLKKFIETDILNYDNKILDKYDFTNWIKNFFK
ncbi:MAG: hypothetical protein HFJ53_07320 [Clostridia bacterium]|nr:hypothetical protein [Clostridia bacterium]